jgi:hypothetical protein
LIHIKGRSARSRTLPGDTPGGDFFYKGSTMKRFVLVLCALLAGGMLSATSASARVWHHHRHHHHMWYHHTLLLHSGGGPLRSGPRCWVGTDDSRGYGYYKWCDGVRHHRHHRHHMHH